MFWKEAWLRPLASAARQSPEKNLVRHASSCTEDNILLGASFRRPNGEVGYSCQATRLMAATTPLKLWDVRQYVEAYRSGNNSLRTVLKALVYVAYYYLTFAPDADAALLYAIDLMAFTGSLGESELGMNVQVPFVQLWTTPNRSPVCRCTAIASR